MSETKFTNGPWVVGELGDVFVEKESMSTVVASVLLDTDDFYNAHLIAAAPELYEALYRLVRDCEIAGLQDQAGFDCWISMANDALAKARGETL